MMRVINRQPSFHSICRLSFHSLSYTLGLSFRKTTTTMLVLITLSCITILLLLITDFQMHFPKEHTSVHVNFGTIASLMSSKISWSISQNDIIIIIYIITFTQANGMLSDDCQPLKQKAKTLDGGCLLPWSTFSLVNLELFFPLFQFCYPSADRCNSALQWLVK